MNALSLPQELYDMIIDHLATDKTSLQACSTVCRAFLPRTRNHLHHTLRISTHLPWPTFSSPCSAISKYVKTLEVKEIPLDALQLDLPQLTTLRIHYYWFKNHLVIPERMRQSVRNLTLSNVHFDSTQQLTALVSSFSELDTLSLSRVDCCDPAFILNDGEHCPSPSTSLKTINLPTSSGTSAPSVLLDWLAHLEADVKVENLHAEWLDGPEHLMSLARFLSARGQQVKNLSLSLHPYCTEQLTPDVILKNLFSDKSGSFDLSSLQSLRLPGLVIGSCAEATNNINPRIADIIRRLATPAHSPHQACVLVPNLTLIMEVRIAGLRELGVEGSLEFDWEDLAALTRTGISSRPKVMLRMLLCCDDLDDISEQEAMVWKQSTEKYIGSKIVVGERRASSISLLINWED